ncbi:hypothetical protein [Halorubrum ezzemoulense]|uniref:Uncharacterized protein n=1 Tax=Halorubrum ezzemoulense TaxID=337243 RepID=A0A256J328_HALEZ|nr:hypothetical protein [Halorubrum ezzemoulense]OYR63229.1 hypothetical protein DJ80_08485 [Halorubrum ezzemoulense]
MSSDQQSGAISRIVSLVDELLSGPSVAFLRECEVCGKEFQRIQFERPEKDLCREHWEQNKPPKYSDYYPPRDYWRAIDDAE